LSAQEICHHHWAEHKRKERRGSHLKLIELTSEDIRDEKSIQAAIERVAGAAGEKPVVLVAAMGQTSRTLAEAGEKSAVQDLVLASALAEGLRTYHVQVAQQVTSAAMFRETRSLVSGLFEELSDFLKGLYLIEEFSQQANLALSRYGERAAAIIVSYVLRSNDLQSVCFYTREVFQESEGLREEIETLVQKGVIPVLPLSLRGSISS
jgi:aspartokinase